MFGTHKLKILTEMLQAQFEECYTVPGGSTVLLRAIPLFRMLGFKRFHIFGCDSCLEENKHHAYEQLENDDELIIPVNVSGKIFNCHPWMVSQAQEFIDLIRSDWGRDRVRSLRWITPSYFRIRCVNTPILRRFNMAASAWQLYNRSQKIV